MTLGLRRELSAFRSIAKAASAALTLDLPIELGSIELEVALQAAEGQTGFARINVIQGAVNATTAMELEAALASRDGGFSARAFSPDGSPAFVSGLMPDAYSVCVMPFPLELSGPRAVFPYLRDHGESMAVTCTSVTIADSPDEQRVVVPITVPALLPPPDA